jgi:phosphatidylglycerol:prolipoprotein diacylglycerol transferase
MLPIIQLGPIAIPTPQFSLLLAFWIGLSISEKFSPRRGVSADSLYNLVFTGLITGLLGARLGYILQNSGAFFLSPQSIVSLNPGLLDPFSGFSFALIATLIYANHKKLPIWALLDALTPFFTIMMAGLAVSHIASGEAFGSETSLPWGITLWGTKRHPSQFYELISATTISCLIIIYSKAKTNTGILFLRFVIMASTSVLFLEIFRGDSLTFFGGIRITQILAWIILAVTLPISAKRNVTKIKEEI